MRTKYFAILLLSFGLMACVNSNSQTPKLKNGDIIFHSSQSAQCEAVQIATDSKYSHCGIIFDQEGELFVYEAVQPVRLTPFDEWIARGSGKKYVVKRLKNADELLTPEVLQKIFNIGKTYFGKSYDLYFEWSDDKIYCSELIWKIYKQALNIEVGKLQKLKEFNLSDVRVKAKLKERYGENIPLEEIVISPASIFDSELLETVASK